MKKVSSIILTLILLAAMLIIPVTVTAEETDTAFTPVSIDFEQFNDSNQIVDTTSSHKCYPYSDTVDLIGGFCFSSSESNVIASGDEAYGQVYYARAGAQGITINQQDKTVKGSTTSRIRFFNTFADAQAGESYKVTFDIKRTATPAETTAKLANNSTTYKAGGSDHSWNVTSVTTADGTVYDKNSTETVSVTLDDTYTYTSDDDLSIKIGLMSAAHSSTPSTSNPCVCGATKAYSTNIYSGYGTVALNDKEWHKAEHEITITPDMADQQALMLAIIGSGEFYIDNINIIKVEKTTITIIDGEKQNIISGEAGQPVEYPTDLANRNYDFVYSLSESEYIPVPDVFGSEDITVYILKSDVLSFENYPQISQIKDAVNVSISDDIAYSGTKSFKWEGKTYGLLKSAPSDWETEWTKYYTYDGSTYINLTTETAPQFETGKYYKNRSNKRESSIGLWKLDIGKSYKVTFKYYIENELNQSLVLMPHTNGTNLWANYNAETKKGSMYYDPSNISISASSETGKWLDGEIYLTTTDAIASTDSLLYIHLSGSTNYDDVVYFDDFTLVEMDMVNFDTGILSAGVNSFVGTKTSTVYNIYAEKGTTFTAPDVYFPAYRIFDNWYTDAEFTAVATEYTAGNTYYARTVERGDCDINGNIDTTDLAILKQYLAGIRETIHMASDLTNDNNINTTDLAVLKKTLAGITEDDSLKVLGIGNSFTIDGTQYLWDVANSAGEKDFLLGRISIGGCSLDTHWSNIQNNSASYYYSKNNSGTWQSSVTSTFGDALVDQEWDVIVIQQVSNYSGKPDTYGNLQNIIDYIKENCPNAKIMWQMTWAYQADSTHGGFANYDNDQMTMYNAIVDTAQEKIVSNNDIDGIIPSGTAIQNLRTVLGDNLTRDGFHLSYDYGRYTAALCWYKAITGNSIDNVAWVPQDYSYIAEESEFMKSSVNDAVNNPFEITNQN